MRVFINYGNYGKVLCRFKLPLRRAGASLTGGGGSRGLLMHCSNQALLESMNKQQSAV